jgi:drug/metabolite transporter (DMT)-like permease
MALHPILLAFLSAALFGAATPASKGLLVDLSPFQLAGLLYLGAAVGVLPVAGLRQVWQVPWRTSRINRWRLWGAVLLGGVVGPVLLLAGLANGLRSVGVAVAQPGAGRNGSPGTLVLP